MNAAWCILLGADLSAQSAATVRLGAPTAILQEGFTYVTSVLGLGGDSVLIADERERRLVVADMRSGEVSPLGRRGSGPGEYNNVGLLWRFRGDTVLAPDPSLATGWHVIHTGDALSNWTVHNSVVVAATNGTGIDGVSFAGYVLKDDKGVDRFTAPPGSPLETNWVIRYEIATGRPDTVARGRRLRPGYYAAGSRTASARGGAGRVGAAREDATWSVQLFEYDAAIMFPDGWIAVARFDPYRVDWCSPSLVCREGPVLGQRPPYSAADKAVLVERLAERSGWPTAITRYSGWPDSVPPFVRGLGSVTPLRIIPDGRLLIERVPTALRPANGYDIVDRTSRLVAQVDLPRTHRIVGFAAGRVYVAIRDAYDVERVHRFDWQ